MSSSYVQEKIGLLVLLSALWTKNIRGSTPTSHGTNYSTSHRLIIEPTCKPYKPLPTGFAPLPLLIARLATFASSTHYIYMYMPILIFIVSEAILITLKSYGTFGEMMFMWTAYVFISFYVVYEVLSSLFIFIFIYFLSSFLSC